MVWLDNTYIIWLSNFNKRVVLHTDGDCVHAQQLFIAWDLKRGKRARSSPVNRKWQFLANSKMEQVLTFCFSFYCPKLTEKTAAAIVTHISYGVSVKLLPRKEK